VKAPKLLGDFLCPPKKQLRPWAQGVLAARVVCVEVVQVNKNSFRQPRHEENHHFDGHF
jgi:hypothetical protein